MNNFQDNNVIRDTAVASERSLPANAGNDRVLPASCPFLVASEEAGVFKVEKQLKGAASAGIRTKLGAPLERLVRRSSTLECALAAEAARFSGSWFPASCASSFFLGPWRRKKARARIAVRRVAVRCPSRPRKKVPSRTRLSRWADVDAACCFTRHFTYDAIKVATGWSEMIRLALERCDLNTRNRRQKRNDRRGITGKRYPNLKVSPQVNSAA